MNNWKCENCIYWKNLTGYYFDDGKVEIDNIKYGECHRYPPKNRPEMSSLSHKVERYVITYNDDYCGEYRNKEAIK